MRAHGVGKDQFGCVQGDPAAEPFRRAVLHVPRDGMTPRRELGANLMLVKKSSLSEEGTVRWTLALIDGPTVNVGEEQSWPTLYVQRDGALIRRVWEAAPGGARCRWHRIRFRVEDAVPLGINLADDPTDPRAAFERALTMAGL